MANLHLEDFYTTLEQEDEEVQYLDEGFDKVDTRFVSIETSYGKYRAPFSSKSQLYKQIKDGCVTSLQHFLPDVYSPSSPISIITSNYVVPAMGSGLAFQGWTYATAAVIFFSQVLPLELDSSAIAWLDTGCGVTLINKNWLLQRLLYQKIKEISTSLKVREIRVSRHESNQFAELSLFFPGENGEREMVYASIKCKLHLVQSLRANILTGNNILAPKDFVINIGLGHAVVRSCGIKITISVRQKDQFLRKRLLAKKDEVVPLRFEVMIHLLPIPLQDNRDFWFYPTAQANLMLFAYIIYHDTTKVLI